MKSLKIGNTLAYIAMIVMNFLADTLPLYGKTTAEISAMFPTMITPTVLTFTIWPVIYIFLGIFILYQWGAFGDIEHSQKLVSNLSGLFITLCLLNIAWLFCWHQLAIGLSAMCSATLLINIIAMISISQNSDDSRIKRLSVDIGFQLFYGWIVIALLVNISAWLVQIEWQRFGLSTQFWTVETLLLGTALGAAIVIIGKCRIAGLALIWGYIGILINHISKAGYDFAYPFIVSITLIGLFAILLAIVLTITPVRKHHKEVSL